MRQQAAVVTRNGDTRAGGVTVGSIIEIVATVEGMANIAINDGNVPLPTGGARHIDAMTIERRANRPSFLIAEDSHSPPKLSAY